LAWLRPYDYALSALSATVGAGRIPPDQLLRHVFEVCPDFNSARLLLEQTPIARPAIYTLVGCAPHERCVIERTETECIARDEDTCTANDWTPPRPGWEGRIGIRHLLLISFAEAAARSRARCEALARSSSALSTRHLDWLREPVLNPYTRLAVTMSPARGILRVAGYDRVGSDLPEPVTQLRELELLPRAA
jgi:hypothetical protein